MLINFPDGGSPTPPVPAEPHLAHPENWPIPGEVLEAVETLWQAALLSVQAETLEARTEAAALAAEALRGVADLVAIHVRDQHQ
jgi:hypothetical protein